MPFFNEQNLVPDFSPGYLMRVIHQMSVARLDQEFAADGMTTTHWMALVLIHFGSGNTCAELARNLAHDAGAVTRMVDAMEARGWVARHRDTDDRRLVNLSLSEDGRAAAMHARRKVIACWNSWLEDWDDAEIAALVAQLQKLHRTIAAKEAQHV